MSENDTKVKLMLEMVKDNWPEMAGAVGVTLGLLTGEPLTIGAASGIGVVIARNVKDFANRFLSQKEEENVGRAAVFAVSAIQTKLKEGKKLRDDWILEIHDGKHSSAEEIFQGVLLKSKNEHQDKKIRLLGNFYANLAFSPEISAPEANHLLKVVDSLTYRQICLLTLFSSKSLILNLNLRVDDYFHSDNAISHEMISLYQEIFDMYTQGLLIRLANDRSGPIQTISSWNEIAPDLMESTTIGIKLASLLNLDIKDNHDFDVIVSQLTNF